jgi:outer membrane protein OmpA-like peptidoglycan-associated protein
MRKRCFILISFLLLECLALKLSAQEYQLQIAAFADKIAPSYFKFLGYSSVHTQTDVNNFTKYTLDTYANLAAAENALQEAKSRGFTNAYIYVKAPESTIRIAKGDEKDQMEGILFIKTLQFSGDCWSLNTDLLATLKESLTVLMQNPNLKLRITGFKNGLDTNISNKRARVIQNFLLANDIPAYRLSRKALNPISTIFVEEKALKSSEYEKIVIAVLDLKEEIVQNPMYQAQEEKQKISPPILTKE